MLEPALFIPHLTSALSCWILEMGVPGLWFLFIPCALVGLQLSDRFCATHIPFPLPRLFLVALSVPAQSFSPSTFLPFRFPKTNPLPMDDFYWPFTAPAAQSWLCSYLLSCSMSWVTALRSASRTSCTSTMS